MECRVRWRELTLLLVIIASVLAEGIIAWMYVCTCGTYIPIRYLKSLSSVSQSENQLHQGLLFRTELIHCKEPL